MMSYTVNDPSRVGRQTYWMYYVGFMVLTWGMYGWAIYEYVKLNAIPIVFGFVAPFIISVYFRVIASRRCRDIGWPAFLPWVTWVLPVALGVLGGLQAGMQAGMHPGVPPTAAIASMGAAMVLSMLMGLLDFVFLIVIGCLDSQEAVYDPSFGHTYDPRDMPQAPRGYLDGEPAHQRAQRIPQSYGEEAPSVSTPPRASDLGARPVQGFGRRGV